jgi:exopolysaccharide biosynthesis polyprenyl glycosylphosphotransferase
VGTNIHAVRFAKKIEAKPELGYRLTGFVDEEWSGISDFKNSGYKLISDFEGFIQFLRENVIDEVIISLPMKSSYDKASRILAACEEQGVIVRNLSDIFHMKQARSKTEYFEGESLVSHYPGAMSGWGWQVAVKRVMDFLLSIFVLIILSPLLILTALLIKITSPGPVFFIHDRVGFNKRRFRLCKFRTMFEGAEQKRAQLQGINEVGGPVFKIKNDPRVTKIGKILRKASIDELPQLINVLKGDMSLVGPRPLPLRDYNGFDQDWHRRRFSVRPGITCLWQVSGRSDIPFEKWMELDLDYIDSWSLWLDAKIIWKTIEVVIKSAGAY